MHDYRVSLLLFWCQGQLLAQIVGKDKIACCDNLKFSFKNHLLCKIMNNHDISIVALSLESEKILKNISALRPHMDIYTIHTGSQ